MQDEIFQGLGMPLFGLFTWETLNPMIFSLGPCNEREVVEKMIEEGGGILQNPEMLDATGHRINLVESCDNRVNLHQPEDDDLFDFAFIKDSYNENGIQLLANYRLNKDTKFNYSDPSDLTNILFGTKKWSDFLPELSRNAPDQRADDHVGKICSDFEEMTTESAETKESVCEDFPDTYSIPETPPDNSPDKSDEYLTIVSERPKFTSATSKGEEGFPFFASSNLDISSGDDMFVTACEELDNTGLNISPETPLSPVTSPSQVLSTPDNLGSHLKNSEAAQRAQLPQRIKPRSPIRDFLNTLQVAPVDMTTPYKKPSAKQNCENLSVVSLLRGQRPFPSQRFRLFNDFSDQSTFISERSERAQRLKGLVEKKLIVAPHDQICAFVQKEKEKFASNISNFIDQDPKLSQNQKVILRRLYLPKEILEGLTQESRRRIMYDQLDDSNVVDEINDEEKMNFFAGDSNSYGANRTALAYDNNELNEMPFSREEEERMVQYLVAEEKACEIYGMVVWKLMRFEDIIINRRWELMREHFFNRIFNNLDSFGLEPEQIREFHEVVASSTCSSMSFMKTPTVTSTQTTQAQFKNLGLNI